MNRLTEEEILRYICSHNIRTGVDGIYRTDLEDLDLDEVRDVVRVGNRINDTEGNQIFKLDTSSPKPNSYAYRPSFAGRQVLLGKEGRILYFSHGRWFIGKN